MINVNHSYVFPAGTSDKMHKLTCEQMSEIKRQADLLRKCIKKTKTT